MKPSIRFLAGNLLLAAVYFVCGKIGLSFASFHASASPIWPPTGVALAVLLIYGHRFWPGIFVGAFLVNLTTPGSLATALAIAAGNTLEATVGALLVSRYAGGCKAFERTVNFFWFVLFAVILSTTLSPTIGVTGLYLAGFATFDAFAAIWLTWWLGDAVSNLTIAPLLVVWITQGFPRFNPRETMEALAALITVILVGTSIFVEVASPALNTYPITYLALPPLLWAAFRFGERGAVTAVSLMGGIALWGTLSERGPFIASRAHESLLFLQAFVATIALTTTVLALAVSERKRAEAQMRLQSVALESAANAIIITNIEGRIEWVNSAFTRLTGYRPNEVLGQTTRILNSGQHPKEFFSNLWETVLAGRVWHGEVVNKRKDGTLYTEEMTVTPVLSESGAQTHFIAIKQDVSERKNAEQLLRQAREDLARANARLEELVDERTFQLRETVTELEHFSYSIVHDLRAPLRAIQGYSAILADAAADALSPEAKDYLTRIQKSVLRMDQLITDVLRFSKAMLSELPLRPVDVASLIQGLLQSYPGLSSDRADIELRGEFPLVIGNEAGLTQCFSNLLNNAVKFVKPGEKPRVRIWAERRDQMVRVWVEDDGVGIPPAGLERLFRMFQRMHGGEYEGTGIGLALVRKVVERMGGHIGVESELGRGSRFWVELRAA